MNEQLYYSEVKVMKVNTRKDPFWGGDREEGVLIYFAEEGRRNGKEKMEMLDKEREIENCTFSVYCQVKA